MRYKFNLEALKNIPILEVLSSFGINQIKGKFTTCLNYKSHNNNDHKPSMYVNMKQNTERHGDEPTFYMWKYKTHRSKKRFAS